MSAQPHLQLVDRETGELVDTCPDCQAKAERIRDLKRDLKAWMTRARNAERDKEREAREHALWETAQDLFAEWKRVCRHPRSVWTVDRFEAVAPLLEKYGVDMCRRAIAGAAFDPWTTQRKNGSVKRHDGWQLVFENAGKLEDFACRAPRDWKP